MDSDLPPPSSLEQKQISTNTKFSNWCTFKHPMMRVLTTILIDIILPLAIFFSLQKYMKSVYVLVLAGVPPFVMVIFKAILSRTFDALGFIVCIGFLASAIIAIITQDPIILLLGQFLVTGVISSFFTITLIPFHRCHHRCQLRPLAYYLNKDLAPKKAAQVGLPESLFRNEQESIDEQYSKHENEVLISKFSEKQESGKVHEWIYTNCPPYRRSCFEITIIWSVGLLLGFLGQLILILVHLSVNKIAIYGRVIITSIALLCIVLTIIRASSGRKQTIILIEQWKKEHLNIQQSNTV